MAPPPRAQATQVAQYLLRQRLGDQRPSWVKEGPNPPNAHPWRQAPVLLPATSSLKALQLHPSGALLTIYAGPLAPTPSTNKTGPDAASGPGQVKIDFALPAFTD